jgi:hypothetical protein
MARPNPDSMDEVYERMREFRMALDRFHESLAESLAELERSHRVVDPLWTDHARKMYDDRYRPLQQRLLQYVRTDGPALSEFLKQRHMWLGRYLYGDRWGHP